MIFLDEAVGVVFFGRVAFLGTALEASDFETFDLAAFDLVGFAVCEDFTAAFLGAAGFAAFDLGAEDLSNAFAFAGDFFEGDDTEFATDRAKGNLNE